MNVRGTHAGCQPKQPASGAERVLNLRPIEHVTPVRRLATCFRSSSVLHGPAIGTLLIGGEGGKGKYGRVIRLAMRNTDRLGALHVPCWRRGTLVSN